ncbi:MAG: hypothetical protein KDC00_01140, partial [Flavobacteriales bacterium]|nr:hypothetical protein [Flavobacteriales bacterium]
MLRTLRVLLPVAIALVSCTKGDKVPAYIDVNAVSVTTEPLQGSATSNITDVWVYADDELLGSWEVPSRIPLLREGSTRIRITPGVKRNGAFDDRSIYPFYTSWTGSVDVMRTTSVELTPVVGYNEAADFWIEAF